MMVPLPLLSKEMRFTCGLDASPFRVMQDVEIPNRIAPPSAVSMAFSIMAYTSEASEANGGDSGRRTEERQPHKLQPHRWHRRSCKARSQGQHRPALVFSQQETPH